MAATDPLPSQEERAGLPPDGGDGFNTLIHETSPYLLQHARNPVHWLPWGSVAFAQAVAEDKPIFLSIGYSTCHWCHVMAHESFEDAAVAAALNRDFITIKVDREERPDVDAIHMDFVQATTGSGGWPLSVWLTPTGLPFTGATYLPRDDFLRVLAAITISWREDRQQILKTGTRVQAWLRTQVAPAQGGGGVVQGDPAWRMQKELIRAYDGIEAGVGDAPKFPQPAWLDALRDAAARDAGSRQATMLVTTLRAMIRGGIHDHLGGGFHRYSVDRRWRVPHFEKMLYDQAQLADLLLDAARLATDGADLTAAVRTTLDFVLAELANPAGGFYAALDADSTDSAGVAVEGAFYVWRAAEVRTILDPADANVVAAVFGVEDAGNVAPGLDPRGELRGMNVLFRAGIEETADLRHRRERGRIALLAARNRRPRPQRDEKILVAWNGLMIGALARAGRILDESRYVQAAIQVAIFLQDHHRDAATGRLRRSWNRTVGQAPGQAIDYAGLIAGLLDLMEIDDDPRWPIWIRELETVMAEDFWDADAGGYFADDGRDSHLAARLKDAVDGAMPSANGLMARSLLDIGTVFDDPTARQRSQAIVATFAGLIADNPLACPNLVLAHAGASRPEERLVLVAPTLDTGLHALLVTASRPIRPDLVMVLLTDRNR